MAEFRAFPLAYRDKIMCNNLFHHLKMCLRWMWRNNEKQMEDFRRYNARKQGAETWRSSDGFPVFWLDFFVNTLIKSVCFSCSQVTNSRRINHPPSYKESWWFNLLTPTNRKVEQKTQQNKTKKMNLLYYMRRQRPFYGDSYMWG